MKTIVSKEEDSTYKSLPIVRLISFAGGSSDFDGPVERFQRQAKELEAVVECVVYREKDLGEDYWYTFSNLHSIEESRGYGFMSWKPHLVYREIQRMQDGDILIYSDIGVELNAAGESRLQDYLDLAAVNGQLFFSISNPNRIWTKNDPLLVPRDRHYFRNQIISGVFLALVCEETRKLFCRWDELARVDNGRLLHEHEAGQAPIRNTQHRHDQSLLSRAVFESQTKGVIPDETYFQPWVLGKDKPFLALRNKFGIESMLPMELKPEPLRKIHWVWFFLTKPHQLRRKLLTLRGSTVVKSDGLI